MACGAGIAVASDAGAAIAAGASASSATSSSSTTSSPLLATLVTSTRLNTVVGAGAAVGAEGATLSEAPWAPCSPAGPAGPRGTEGCLSLCAVADEGAVAAAGSAEGETVLAGTSVAETTARSPGPSGPPSPETAQTTTAAATATTATPATANAGERRPLRIGFRYPKRREKNDGIASSSMRLSSHGHGSLGARRLESSALKCSRRMRSISESNSLSGESLCAMALTSL